MSGTLYAVVGIKIEYTDDPSFQEKIKPYLERTFENNTKNDITVFIDRMSLKYMIIGKAIAQADEYGFDFTRISFETLEKVKEETRIFLKEKCAIDSEPELLFFTSLY